MKPPTKRVGRALSKNDAAPASSKLTKVNPERETVQRLQYVLAEIDRLPLPAGSVGTAFLDALELCDKIREKVRQKARELLLESPGIIPGWSVSEASQRVLSKNTQAVFDALARRDDMLTPKRFIGACSVSLSAIRKLITELNPDMSPDEIEHALNRALSELISFEKVIRLARTKDKQIQLSL